jgi:hypothetical protein
VGHSVLIVELFSLKGGCSGVVGTVGWRPPDNDLPLLSI